MTFEKRKEALFEKVKAFPKKPGVYLMKDSAQRVIYVGKAKDLRVRVKQYFSNHDTRYQIRFLMERVVRIDFLQTSNEKEALLLENSLIKKHKPKYNVFLKDDKTYLGLRIGQKHLFPRITTTRRLKKDKALYYGPFTSGDSLRQVKEFIDQYFMLRTCTDREFSQRTRPCLEYQIKRCSAPCVAFVDESHYREQINEVRQFLEGKNKALQKTIQIKMKEAAAKEDFEEAARYRDLLNHMERILIGQNVTHLSFDFVDLIALKVQEDRVGIGVLMVRESQLIDSTYKVFKTLEEKQDFLVHFISQYYSANSFIPKEILIPFDIRLDQLELLEVVLKERAGRKVKIRQPKRGEKKDLLHLAEQNLVSHFVKSKDALDQKEVLLTRIKDKLHLSRLPERIECYDISNISGEYAVASQVSFVQGEKDSDGYRKFKIKTVQGPNDFAMLKEVLLRRFSQSDDKELWPDLILIDGGKGQLNAVAKVLDEINVIDIDLVGIAKGKGEGARAKGQWDSKKEEDFYLINRKNPVHFRTGSPELMLLQRIRDEAHRFAITFHRNLRDKESLATQLEGVPGLGPKKVSALLKEFGSYKGILTAEISDLLKVSGITEEIVKSLQNLDQD